MMFVLDNSPVFENQPLDETLGHKKNGFTTRKRLYASMS